MFRRILGVALSLALATPAFASEWWVVTSSNPENVAKADAMLTIMDRESIQTVSPKTKRAWSRVFYNRPAPEVASVTVLEEFDCDERKSRVLSFATFDRQGRTQDNINQPTGWQFVPPDSNGSYQLNFACGMGTGGIHKIAPSLSLPAFANTFFSMHTRVP